MANKENLNRTIVYAPNIHIGGGFVLLKAMLESWPKINNLILFVDERVSSNLRVECFPEVYFVKATLIDRFRNEILLAKIAQQNDVVFCFHSLPPLFHRSGKIIVYHQNALLLKSNILFGYKFSTIARIYCERLVAYILSHRVSEYIVQTSNMADNVIKLYESAFFKRKTPLKVSVVPFASNFNNQTKSPKKKWDFIYVADGLNHKNHNRLLDAWLLLANDGIKPSLVLTIPSHCTKLVNKINILKTKGVNIFNIGPQPHEKLQKIYSQTRALVYPSLIESFGLPLIEASMLNLNIISSELDYVYDVCRPTLTFDPFSINSIARSIKKYLGQLGDLEKILTPVQFSQIMSKNSL